MQMERVATHKSQYLDGEVFAMAGASTDHNQITSNIIGMLYNQLRGRGCRTYGSDMMILVEKTGLRTYPDISGTCEPVKIIEEGIAMLLNPAFLIEILSPSTEAYDRGEKFKHYSAIPSLKEYVLISTSRKAIDMYRKQDDGSWKIELGLETVDLMSVGAALSLNDVYELVEL